MLVKLTNSLALGCVPLFCTGSTSLMLLLGIMTSIGSVEFNTYYSSVKIFDVNVTRVTFTSSALPLTPDTLMMNVDFPTFTDSSIPKESRFGCSNANIGPAVEGCYNRIIYTIYDAVIDSGICSVHRGCSSPSTEINALSMKLYQDFKCNDVDTFSKLVGNVKEQCAGFYPILTREYFAQKWSDYFGIVIAILLPAQYVSFVIIIYFDLPICPNSRRRRPNPANPPQSTPLPLPVRDSMPQENPLPLSENVICPITLETITGEYVRCNSCNNNFKATVLYQWVNVNQSCPLCRKELTIQMAYDSTFICPQRGDTAV